MKIIQQEELQSLNGFGLFPKRFACVKTDDPSQYLIHSASKDMDVTSNAVVFFNVTGYRIVQISQALYRWLLEQSPKSDSLWISTEGFQPDIPQVPLPTLPLDKDKCEQYNAKLEVLIEEYKEQGLFKNAPKAEERFRPYQLITKVTEPELILLDEDLYTSVIYVSNGNAHNDINTVTNYDLPENHPNDNWLFGLADNATQVVNHLNNCIRTYFTGHDRMDDWHTGLKLVSWMQRPEGKLLLTTNFIPKGDEPQCGFRWHKNGEYIGKHDVQCEYLNDEVGIDYVMQWSLYLIEPEQD